VRFFYSNVFILHCFIFVSQVDEAKQELRDIVEFLKNPTKFSSLGGKLPKGIL